MAQPKKMINALWDVPDNKWSLKEDYLNEGQQKSVVDGKNILALVEGVFFVPNGVSRNERYYPKTFWESVLQQPGFGERMSSRLLMGTIGHYDREVNEEDISEGRVSHIVTNLWIAEDTGMGMGQALILGTPAGKNLYMLMKAGCKIKTSSRASGDYKQDEEYNGMPIVDENGYCLETFDFVINPGFLETNPALLESVSKIKEKMETENMELGKELLEYMNKEKASVNEAYTKLREDFAVLESKNADLNAKVLVLESIQEELSKAKEEIKNITESTKEFSVIKEDLEAYKLIGEAKEIKESIDESTNLLEAYSKLGKPEQISKSIKEAREYKKFGSVADLDETIPMVEELLEEYAKLGTLEEITEIVSLSKAMLEKNKQEKLDDSVMRISKAYRTPAEYVKTLLETIGEKETTRILEEVNKTNKAVIKEEKTAPRKEIITESKPSRLKETSLISEMFRSHMRGNK